MCDGKDGDNGLSEKLIRIGVISDSHFTSLDDGLEFFDQLFDDVFADVELILHAGDIVHPDLLASITTCPVLAVRGNCDVAAPDLPQQRIVTRGGFRIGMTHGWGPLSELERRVRSAFAGEPLDVLIYGHSHFPVCRREGSLLLVNPGSPTDRRQAPFHSVALLTLGRKASGQIVNLDARMRERRQSGNVIRKGEV